MAADGEALTDGRASTDDQHIPGAFTAPSEPSAPPSATRHPPPPPPAEEQPFTATMAESAGPIGIANVSQPLQEKRWSHSKAVVNSSSGVLTVHSSAPQPAP